MTLSFIRGLFVIISGVVGYSIGSMLLEPVFGTQIGLLSGLILILVEGRLHRVSVHGLTSMVFGLLLGVFMAKLISDILLLLPLGTFIHSTSRIVLTVIFSYLGAVMALRGKDEFNIIIPYVKFRRQDVNETVILVDTSVVIDGRIGDIYKSHFLIGRLVVPRFVLRELQQIADSDDEIKRERGRRGMEILQVMLDDPKIDVHVHEEDIREVDDVDTKLIRLAKLMDARICTTDFNLDRVASLQGILVLNPQVLTNAVKSILFVGDQIEVKLVKEGREADQAVGYLDDGTMIVVSQARSLLGQNVKVIVSSVLQTQAGKMIFAKLDQ